MSPTTNPVPQYVVPAKTQTVPQDTPEKKADSAEIARQAYIASLLNNGKPAVAPVSPANIPAETSVPAGVASATTLSGTPPEVSKQAVLDLMTHLTARSNKCIALAQAKAKELQSNDVDGEHMLIGLLSDSVLYKILTDLQGQLAQFETYVAPIFKRS